MSARQPVNEGPSGAAIRRWAHGTLQSLDIEVICGGERFVADRPLLTVANHVSWIDICAVASARGASFVAKAEVRDWPMVGRIAGRFGTFFHVRGNFRDAAHVKDRVAAALRAGHRVAVFPEGTTSDGATLLPFRAAFLQAAIDADAMVQPCAIRYPGPGSAPNRQVAFVGDETFAQSLGRILRQDEIVADLTFGPAIRSAGKSRRELVQEVRAFIADALCLAPVADEMPERAVPRSGWPMLLERGWREVSPGRA